MLLLIGIFRFKATFGKNVFYLKLTVKYMRAVEKSNICNPFFHIIIDNEVHIFLLRSGESTKERMNCFCLPH